MRTPFIAGNWKMYKTAAEGAALAQSLRVSFQGITEMELAVCPPAPALRPGAIKSRVPNQNPPRPQRPNGWRRPPAQ